jgi:hypothetical protein
MEPFIGRRIFPCLQSPSKTKGESSFILNRDTETFAFKCSAVEVESQFRVEQAPAEIRESAEVCKTERQ